MATGKGRSRLCRDRGGTHVEVTAGLIDADLIGARHDVELFGPDTRIDLCSPGEDVGVVSGARIHTMTHDRYPAT